MLHRQKLWQFQNEHVDKSIQQELTLNVTSTIKELLIQRGIETNEQAEAFLYPKLEHLLSAELLKDIDKATERIMRAIETGERILVYGDYDADGVTSTTVLLETLEELGAYCDFYIPNRFTEGYGPNEMAFRKASEAGVSLIITVDNGIAGVHEAEVCKELGIDLIITDHHEKQEQLPDAFAIIHPKCAPDYAFKELAGVGVAFKLSEYLLGYFPEQYLDLVAVGTIADLVSLTEENRVLVYFGLKALTHTKRPGFMALKEITKIEGDVTEEDVGFLIGPRLNAVGRLQDADLAVELLKADDLYEAKEIAQEIQELNTKRQKIVSDITKEAEQIVQEMHPDRMPGVLVVSKEGWNEGVLGIVASKLVRTFDRPAIVMAKKPEEGIVKGSARSIPAFDLFANCMEIKDLFIGFGGHSQAAGMTLSIDKEARLRTELDKLIHAQLDEQDFKQELTIAKEITIEEADESLVEELALLAPFGMDNPKPLFKMKQTPIEKKQLGNMKKHLKLLFNENGQSFEAIGFGYGASAPFISESTPISIVGELGINEWNGFRKVQMLLKDFEIDEWQLFDYRGKKTNEMEQRLTGQENVLIVTDEPDEKQYTGHQCITYEENLATLNRMDTVVFENMPSTLSQVKSIIKQTNPNNICACFYVENSSYLNVLPTRKDFVWFYKFIVQQGQLDLKKDLANFLKYKGWTKDWFVFVVQVFEELNFITIENRVIIPTPNPIKADLTEATIYQDRMEKAQIEKVLYYSTYKELKQWFHENGMNSETISEEELLTNGI